MSTPETGAPAAGTALRWRRVHPVTPFVRGWAVIVAVLFFGSQQVLDDVAGALEAAGRVGSFWWIVLLVVVVFLAVVFGYAALAWRMTTYAVDDDAAHLRKGVLFRQQRHARLDRLQAVDVRQPLLARLFGLAELRLEVAGGTDSAVAIGFLKEAEAQRLRADLLARAAGIRAGRSGRSVAEPGPRPVVEPGPRPVVEPVETTDGVSTGSTGVDGVSTGSTGVDGVSTGSTGVDGVSTGSTGVDGVSTGSAGDGLDNPDDLDAAPEAPERPVYEVPPSRLLLSLLRLPGLWVAVLFLVGLGVVVATTGSFGVLVSAAPAVLGVGGYLFQRFAGEFGFRAALSPDGIRLRHGLLETRAQTIPPGRVQAVSLTQGPWWRGPDWWRVRVNVAGYGGAEGSADESQSVLLPVGPRSEALTALWLVLPDLEAGDPEETLALLDEALDGDARTDRWFVTSPRSARLLDPLSWRRNGYAITGRALFARGGRWVRHLEVVPHERTQSLGLDQGPWQRRRGLASVALHTTPGPVTPVVQHLDAAEAARLLGEQSVRARAARAHAGPERWMEAPQ